MTNKTNNYYLLLISAKTPAALAVQTKNYINYLEYAKDALGDICYTSQIGRAHLPCRLAVIGKTKQEILKKLKVATLAKPQSIPKLEKYFIQNLNHAWQLHLQPEDKSYKTALQTLAELYLAGGEIDWRHFGANSATSHRKVGLPSYPFQHQHFWIEEEDAKNKWSAIDLSWLYQDKWVPSKEEAIGKNTLKNWLIISATSTVEVLQLIKELNHSQIKMQLVYPQDVIKYLQKNSDLVGIIDAVSRENLSQENTAITGIVAFYQKLLVYPHIKRLIVLTEHAQATDIQNQLVDPWQRTLWGLARAISWEYPHLNCQVIDVAKKNLVKIKYELLKQDSEEEIIYENSQRLVKRVEKNLNWLNSDSNFDLQGTYLITGGLGGLGMKMTYWLLEQGIKNLVLISRHKPDAKQLAEINKWQEIFNAKIWHQAADVTDYPQLSAIINAIPELTTHSLRGVFHLAGIDERLAFADYSEAQLAKVLSPKIWGAYYLHQLTQSVELTHFVLFSSIAAFFGSNRQAAYVMANSFLDGLAEQRRHLNMPVTCINWGPWLAVGMAARFAEHVDSTEAFIPVDAGFRALNSLLKMAESKNLAVVSPKYIQFMLSINPHKPAQYTNLYPQEMTPVINSQAVAEINNEFLKNYQTLEAGQRLSSVEKLIHDVLCKILKLSSSQVIDKDRGFFELGMDSITAMEFAQQLQKAVGLGVNLKPLIAFDYPNIAKLSLHINELMRSKIITTAPKSPIIAEDKQIAVIGMSCRFPGGANSPELFWKNLIEGQNAITLAPQQRWDANKYPYHGGFIDNIEQFDAAFFNISPREAESLDPQQRLLLETSWHALENAGIAPASLRDSETGVFIGISQSDYKDLLADAHLNADIYAATGNALNAAAGRIAYTLGLQGPTMAIDTACSSSLVALHEACCSLQLGECDLAISGGVNALLKPEVFTQLTQANMLSAEGYCKTFDATADGYVRGEGCGIILLKRLKDAQAAGDNILAVIKGSAVNQDGASSGLTVPNGVAQQKVINKALKHAGLSPMHIDHVEAHGTGTRLGDPIEVAAIADVYCKNRSIEQPLIISTVKTQIGHLESAAGIAGVIKTVLALQHKIIPPHLHLQQVNAHINLTETPIKIPTSVTEWKAQGHLRAAGVSAFGFTGTNAHVILSEPEMQATQAAAVLPSTYLLVVSAKTPDELNALLKEYQTYLQQTVESVENICYTSQTGRNHFAWRAAILGSSKQNLLENLTNGHYQVTEQIVQAAESQLLPAEFAYAKNWFNYTNTWELSLSPESELYPKALEVLATLFTKGFNVNWQSFSKAYAEAVKRIILPNYIFTHLPYWPKTSLSQQINAKPGTHPFLNKTIRLSTLNTTLFEGELSAEYPEFVQHHKVYGQTIVAGPVHLATLVAVMQAMGILQTHIIKDVHFIAPLVVAADTVYTIRMLVSKKQQDYQFSILSNDNKQNHNDNLHVQGSFVLNTEITDATEAPQLSLLIKDLAVTGYYSADEHQKNLAELNFNFGKHHLWLEYANTNDNAAIAHMRVAEDTEKSKNYSIYPGLLDACTQTALAIFSKNHAECKIAHVPVVVEYMQILDISEPPAWVYVRKEADETFAYFLYSEAGKNIAVIRGFKTHKATRERLLDTSSIFYKNEWKKLAVNEYIREPLKHDQWWVITENSPKELTVLLNELSSSKKTCLISKADASAITNSIKALKQQPINILYLAPIVNIDDLRPCTEFLEIVQQLQRQSIAAELWIATQSAYAVENDTLNLAHSTLNGFIRTLQLECPQFNIKQIDVDSSAPLNKKLLAITEFCKNPLVDSILAYRNKHIFRPLLNNVTSELDNKTKFKEDVTYLITGAFGALGLLMAEWLIKRGAKHLLLIGRTVPNTAVLSKIEALRKQGAELHIEYLDISNKTAVEKLILDCQQQPYPLKGIFHAAGIILDAPVYAQNAEKFSHVFAGKALGAWYLHEITQANNIQLDYFVLFSSFAAINGSPGQSNYAAANSFLDGLAQYRKAQQLNVSCINWGPWREVGMAKDLAEMHARYGLKPLAAATGINALEVVIQNQLIQIAVIQADWDVLANAQPQRRAWLAELVTHHDVTIKESIVDKNGEKNIPAVIAEAVKRILAIENVAIDNNESFFNLGMDSLMLQEFRNYLQTALGDAVKLSTDSVLTYNTINSLAAYLATFTGKKLVNPAGQKFLVCLRKINNNKPPLFCIHGIDGSGEIFFDLANQADFDRSIYAFNSPEIADKEFLVTSIEDRAALYIKQIKYIQPHGPYHILGWSYGATLSLEIVSQLEKANEKVDFIGILDGIIANPEKNQQQFTFLDAAKFYLYVITKRYKIKNKEGVLTAEMTENEIVTNIVTLINCSGKTIIAPSLVDKIIRIIHLNFNHLFAYHPKPIHQALTLFIPKIGLEEGLLEKNQLWILDGSANLWEKLCVGVAKNYTVEGDHFSMLSKSKNRKLLQYLAQHV